MSSPITVWRNHKNLRNYLGMTGKILVWTKVYIAPAGFEHEAPYFVAIIKLDNGKKMPLQMVECEEKDLKINRKVALVIRKLGKVGLDKVIEYGVKAKPI